MATNVTWNNSVRSVPAGGELNWTALSAFLIDLGGNAQTTNFQKIGMRVATATPITVAATTDCVVVSNLSVAGAVAVTLPAGVAGQMFAIVDGKGDAATNNITITPAAGNINGAATYVINGNRNGIIIAYNGTEWTIIAEFLSSSAGSVPRTQIAAATANYVLINDGSGNMSEEAALASSRGGLGANASAFTGVLKASTGTMTAAALLNADVDAAAAIAHTKLADIAAGSILMGNASNVPTATAVSGDIAITNAGVASISSGVIVNADINASAAIVDTKLDTIATALKVSNSATTAASANTASAIVARDPSGNFTAGTITANLTGNASGTAANVTGTVAIANGGTGQTGATAAFNALSPVTTQGDIIVRGAANNERLAVGSEGQTLKVTSGVPAWGDAGGGSGEKNYVINPSAASAITGWNNVGDLDVVRTTEAIDANSLPRQYTTATGIKITADANVQSVADYVYYDFTLDDVDLNKKLKIQWSQKQFGAYVAGRLAVVITTQADRTTAVATPDVTLIPAYDGVFTASFDTASTATLSLVIRATDDMDDATGIVISDVIVGPGTITPVPASGPSQSFTPSFVSSCLGTLAASTAHWKRDDDVMKVQGTVTAGTVTGSNLIMTLPNSEILATTSASGQQIGKWWRGNASASTRKTGAIFVIGNGSNNFVYFSSDDTAATLSPFAATPANSLLANSDVISFAFDVRIAAWAGSPNYAGQNTKIYLSNSDMTNAAATGATTVYQQNGSPFPAVTYGASRNKVMTLPRPMQVGEVAVFEVDINGNGSFTPFGSMGPSGGAVQTGISQYAIQNGNDYGAGIVSISATEVTVRFAQYAVNPSTYGAAGTNWAAGTATSRWRVTVYLPEAAVGFGAATSTSMGLISREAKETFSSTFKGVAGGANSASIDMLVSRVGNQVQISVPTLTTVVPTTSSTQLISNSALPVWARPITEKAAIHVSVNNGSYVQTTMGYVNVGTDGILKYLRDITATAYTNSANAGWFMHTISYNVD